MKSNCERVLDISKDMKKIKKQKVRIETKVRMTGKVFRFFKFLQTKDRSFFIFEKQQKVFNKFIKKFRRIRANI